MTREEKAQIIEELSQKFAENMHFYIADASGLTVEQVNTFRKLCFKNGVEYGVYKNTMIRKALEKQEESIISLSKTFFSLEVLGLSIIKRVLLLNKMADELIEKC